MSYQFQPLVKLEAKDELHGQYVTGPKQKLDTNGLGGLPH